MRRPLAVAAGLVIGAAAIVAFGLFSLQRLTPDASPPDDADLRPTAAAVSDADNAYYDFVKIAAKPDFTQEERSLLSKENESPSQDLTPIESLIARSAEILRHFADFSRRARFCDPNYQDAAKVSFETPVLQHSPMISAARLSSLRATILLRQRRAPEALEEALGVMDAGQVLLSSEQPLVTALAGMIIEDTGARRVRDVIEKGALDKPRLMAAARRLSTYRSGVAALQASLRFEYLMASYMLDHLRELAPKGPEGRLLALTRHSLFLYQPERTRGLFALRMRPIIEEAAKPCLQAHPPVQDHLPLDAKPNVVGKIMFNIALPQYEKLYIRRCAVDFHVAAALTQAALAAYRLDHKRYPASLDELVPNYLASVPADPFTGSQPLYSPSTGKVSSAGKDIDGKAL